MKKGIVNIEFIMAVFIFLSSISFTTLSIARDFFSIREASFSDTIKLQVTATSQLLLFDRGFPENWETGPVTDVKRLGLSSGNKFILDLNKINALQTFCTSNYAKIKDLLNVQGDIILNIKAIDGTQFLDCKPSVESLLRPKFPSEAYAVIVQGNRKQIVKFTTTLVV